MVGLVPALGRPYSVQGIWESGPFRSCSKAHLASMDWSRTLRSSENLQQLLCSTSAISGGRSNLLPEKVPSHYNFGGGSVGAVYFEPVRSQALHKGREPHLLSCRHGSWQWEVSEDSHSGGLGYKNEHRMNEPTSALSGSPTTQSYPVIRSSNTQLNNHALR